MKRLAAVACLLLLVLAAAPGDRASAADETARRAYAQGRFAEAARAFEETAGGGIPGLDACLDTATAWRLAGDPGRAALWLHRAHVAAPGDAAVGKALAAAGLVAPDTGLFLGNRMTPRGLWLAALAANAVFWLGLGLARLVGRRIPRAVTAAAALLAFWLWVEVGWRELTPVLAPRGVVLGETAVRCGPEQDDEPLFTLAPGTLVAIGSGRPGARRVDAGGDRIGWVSPDAIAPVVP